MLHLFEEMDALKNQKQKVANQLGEEKRNNIKIIKSYQQKMIEYYNHFGQFKKELYYSMKE